MSMVNVYENEINKVNALQKDIRFLDFEDDNDDI